MSDDERWLEIKKIMRADPELFEEKAKQDQVAKQEEFDDFLSYAKRGECYVCGKKLDYFDRSEPCAHWLIRPPGAKKKDIINILTEYGYHRSAAILRWFANFESAFRNINDLSGEGKEDAVFHWTCVYKGLRWTFECLESDYNGSHWGNTPHYHVEVKINGQRFIQFSEHVPFTDEDLFFLKANRDVDSPLKQSFGPHGAGMDDALSLEPEKILEIAKTGFFSGEDEGQGVYHSDSFVYSENGISGDQIADIIAAAKKSGRTIASHLIEAGLEPQVIISAADSVPEKAHKNNPRAKD